MYQVTYQKSNGEIFYRIRNTLPRYRVGEATSMGWILLDIKYNIFNEYYSFVDYKRIIRDKKQRTILKLKHLFKKTP